MCNTNRVECGVSREVDRGANKGDDDDGREEKEGLREAFSPKIKADLLSFRGAAVDQVSRSISTLKMKRKVIEIDEPNDERRQGSCAKGYKMKSVHSS